MGLPLRKLAMKLLFFQILALTVEVVSNFTPDEDQVAPALKVAHFDCSEMTENTLYALNQVRPCHITPEELEISKAKIVLYTKHLRKEPNLQNAEYNTNEKKGTADIMTIAALIILLQESQVTLLSLQNNVELLAKGKDITVHRHSINFGFDTKNPIVKTYGDTSDDYRNECDGKGWITRDTFLPHMQTTILKVTLENEKFYPIVV